MRRFTGLFVEYLAYIGISYYLAKYTEAYFWKNASPELIKEPPKLPELDTILEFNEDVPVRQKVWINVHDSLER